MKTPLLLLAVLCLLPNHARADEEKLTAVPIRNVIEQIERTPLTFRGHALIFGFDTIESCIYSGEGLLLLSHYCHPKAEYPARGFAVWSKQFGIVELYEEKFDNGVMKRDIRINEFPESVRHTFSMDFRTIEPKVINEVLEKLYNRWNPACWSTNYDWNYETPAVDCLDTEIDFYPAWKSESQRIVGSAAEWGRLWERVLRKLGKSRTL